MKDRERAKIAKESARLLYYSFVEDYKSAKEVACNSFGIRTLPSNFEVAMELDKLADELEGTSRGELLIDLRKKTLQIMDEIASFNPKLVGSIWRGTSKKGSDIDITAYSESEEAFVDIIKSKYSNVRAEYKSKTSKGVTKEYFHVIFTVPPGYEVEIVVKSFEEMHKRYKCEVYGDFVVGLTRHQLRKLFEKDATKRFLPEEKKG